MLGSSHLLHTLSRALGRRPNWGLYLCQSRLIDIPPANCKAFRTFWTASTGAACSYKKRSSRHLLVNSREFGSPISHFFGSTYNILTICQLKQGHSSTSTWWSVLRLSSLVSHTKLELEMYSRHEHYLVRYQGHPDGAARTCLPRY